jgi:hypothetical protein
MRRKYLVSVLLSQGGKEYIDKNFSIFKSQIDALQSHGSLMFFAYTELIGSMIFVFEFDNTSEKEIEGVIDELIGSQFFQTIVQVIQISTGTLYQIPHPNLN